MTGPSLDGVLRKYARGKAHFQAFEEEIARVVGVPSENKRAPINGYVESHDGLTGTVVFTVGELPDIENSDCSVILGDGLLNFRAALDHLAWIIVKRCGTPLSRLSPRERQGIQFPLAKSSKTFPKTFERRLPGIPIGGPLYKAIALCQPYRRGNVGGAMRALRDLTNRDKHRLLITTGWYIEEMSFKLVAPGYSILEKEILVTSRRPLKTGTKVVRATATRISVHPGEMELQCEGALYPALVGGWHARPVMQAVEGYTAGIIHGLKVHL